MKKNNVLNYLEFEAEINFRADSMILKGTIAYGDISEVFYAHSIETLKKAYEDCVALVSKKNNLKADANSQLIKNFRFVESGEARLKIAPSETELEIGVKIRHLLSLADGAAFEVQETTEQGFSE